MSLPSLTLVSAAADPWSIAATVVAGLDATAERADRALRRALRSAPTLDDGGRALAGRLVHGTRCWEATVEVILWPLGRRPRAEERVAAYAVSQAGFAAEEVSARLPGTAAAIALARDAPRWRRALERGDDVEVVGRQGSMPPWAAARLVRERGRRDALRLAGALNLPGPLTLRANRARLSPEELLAALRAEGHDADRGRAPDAVEVRSRLNVRGHPLWQAGAFEVQDAGSQLIAASVDARPGERVVDLCAGRGGKTLALAAAVAPVEEGAGRVVAVDVDAGALRDLRARLRRASVGVVDVVALDEAPAAVEDAPTALPAALAGLRGAADRVLVDAPCSAFGTLRRGPDHRWRLCADEADAFPHRQSALLLRGAELVRPGGRLVYATCTVFAAENGDVADAFEAAVGGRFRPVPVLAHVEHGYDSVEGARVELSPWRHGTDGFFIAAWTRTGR